MHPSKAAEYRPRTGLFRTQRGRILDDCANVNPKRRHTFVFEVFSQPHKALGHRPGSAACNRAKRPASLVKVIVDI